MLILNHKRCQLFFELFLTIACTSLFAASFNCGNAVTAVEKMVCGSAPLSKLDTQLATTYHLALEDLDAAEKDTLRKQQEDWIRNARNQCSTSDCLIGSYSSRISRLSAINAGSAQGAYIVDDEELKSQIKRLQEQLRTKEPGHQLTECTRMIRVVYGGDGRFVSRSALATPTYGSACKLDGSPVLVCSNPILNDLDIKFQVAKTGRDIVAFSAQNCPFSG